MNQMTIGWPASTAIAPATSHANRGTGDSRVRVRSAAPIGTVVENKALLREPGMVPIPVTVQTLVVR